MKFLVVSDTHLEFHQDKGKEFIDSLPDADGIILAGDITTRFTLKPVVERFLNRFKDVVFVPGNHEYYGSNPARVNSILKTLEKDNERFHYLKNSYVELGEKRIHGTTLWFPEHPDIPPMINDFNAIDGFVPWVYRECEVAQKYLHTHVREGDIVVTHHLPAKGSISSQYVGLTSNAFFLCDVEQTIRDTKPSMWCHGHCVDSETEILTTEGWKDHHSICVGDKVYSVAATNHLKLEQDKVEEVFEYPSYVGEVFEYQSRRLSMRITSHHSVIFLPYGKKILKKLPAHEFFKRDTGVFLKAAILEQKGLDLTDDELTLYISVIADGSRCNKNLGRLRFIKERKIQFCEALLSRMDISYTKNKQKDNSWCMNFTVPAVINKLSFDSLDSCLLGANRHQAGVIRDAYRQTDGNRDLIFTSKRQEVDLLQHLFVINGYSCKIFGRTGHGFSKGESFQLSVTDRPTLSVTELGSKVVKRKIDKELFWCVRTRNGNFLARRNGHTFITGNSHDSCDYQIENTRVMCNPYGYPGMLNPKFENKFIEI